MISYSGLPDGRAHFLLSPGEASAWYDVLRRRWGDTQLGWAEFKRHFLAKYVSSTLRFQRAQEFEALRQTPDMSVERHDALFTELS